MGDHQIELHIEQVPNVALIVFSGRFSWAYVATYGVMPRRYESIAHSSAVFAGYQHSHSRDSFENQFDKLI